MSQDAVDLRQECLDLIAEAERRAKDNKLGDVAYRNAIHRLKKFLRDGETSFYVGKQRWLKPSEVTEPGIYWQATSVFPDLAPVPVRLRESGDGELFDTESGDFLSETPALRFLGPIQPPEYKGE